MINTHRNREGNFDLPKSERTSNSGIRADSARPPAHCRALCNEPETN